MSFGKMLGSINDQNYHHFIKQQAVIIQGFKSGISEKQLINGVM